MEELWKDITLSCNLQNEIPTTPPLSLQHLPPRANNMVFQDFLAGAQVTPPPPPPPRRRRYHHSDTHHHHIPIDLNQMDSDSSSQITSLCPNKWLLDHQQQQQRRRQQMMMNIDHRFGVDVIVNDVDRRHKRMIKNRESAARSRARKQAYKNELELEVAHLVRENTELRRQYEELKSAMAAQIPSSKRTLRRASSASF